MNAKATGEADAAGPPACSGGADEEEYQYFLPFAEADGGSRAQVLETVTTTSLWPRRRQLDLWPVEAPEIVIQKEVLDFEAFNAGRKNVAASPEWDYLVSRMTSLLQETQHGARTPFLELAASYHAGVSDTLESWADEADADSGDEDFRVRGVKLTEEERKRKFIEAEISRLLLFAEPEGSPMQDVVRWDGNIVGLSAALARFFQTSFTDQFHSRVCSGVHVTVSNLSERNS